jgi:hypothetical protein
MIVSRLCKMLINLSFVVIGQWQKKTKMAKLLTLLPPASSGESRAIGEGMPNASDSEARHVWVQRASS